MHKSIASRLSGRLPSGWFQKLYSNDIAADITNTPLKSQFRIFVIYTKRILHLFGWTHIIVLIELNERVNEMSEYISAPEAAKKWGISERRVQKLCEENRK